MKNGSKILTIVLALVAVAALVFGFVANGQKGTIEADLNKQIEELEGTLKAKTDELTATTEELTALKEEAAKAAEEAAKAAEEAAKAAEEEAAKAAEEAAKAAEEAAKVPEGYPAIIEGLDFGGATVYFYDCVVGITASVYHVFYRSSDDDLFFLFCSHLLTSSESFTDSIPLTN